MWVYYCPWFSFVMSVFNKHGVFLTKTKKKRVKQQGKATTAVPEVATSDWIQKWPNTNRGAPKIYLLAVIHSYPEFNKCYHGRGYVHLLYTVHECDIAQRSLSFNYIIKQCFLTDPSLIWIKTMVDTIVHIFLAKNPQNLFIQLAWNILQHTFIYFIFFLGIILKRAERKSWLPF